MIPAIAPKSTPLSPVKSLSTSFLNVVSNRYPEPIAIPSASALSRAFPVKSCSTAKLEFTPFPDRKSLRTIPPGPFGAASTTSTFSGGTTPVSSLNTIENPCEKYRVFPSVRCGFSVSHIAFCPASESRYITTVPFAAASSSSKSVSPSTQPSLIALSQDPEPFL